LVKNDENMNISLLILLGINRIVMNFLYQQQRFENKSEADFMARLVENPALAYRLARAIVSDVALYNQEKVAEGIKNDTIFDLMTEELDEGREHFYSRVSADLPDRDNMYDRAIVDVMIKQAGKIESTIW